MEIEVFSKDDKKRLDLFLSENLPSLSRSMLKGLIEDGSVKRVASDENYILVKKAGLRVSTGDIFSVTLPEIKSLDVLPQDIPLDILYEDNDIIIINKEKGMVVHPAPGHEKNTLVNAVLYHAKGSLSGINGVLRPGIVHRIDRDTTGSLIICKNDNSHTIIAKQIEEHTVNRIYEGIVIGNIKEDEGTINKNIKRSDKDRKKMAVTSAGGKEAKTHYKVLERFKGYTYMSFKLETGRTHQIRVHMSSIGHPLLGDAVYGGSDKRFKDLYGQTLHAKTIGFIHPVTNEYMEFEAELPDYFKELLSKLKS